MTDSAGVGSAEMRSAKVVRGAFGAASRSLRTGKTPCCCVESYTRMRWVSSIPGRASRRFSLACFPDSVRETIPRVSGPVDVDDVEVLKIKMARKDPTTIFAAE